MKELTPHLVLGHGHFFQDTLLSASRFVDYCKKRGIDISEKRLEKFEKLGIFYPHLRIRYPEIKIKRKTIKEERKEPIIKEYGILQKGEIWDGELRKDYASFIHFDKEYVDSWIKRRFVFTPTKATFKPWSKFRDKKGFPRVESYYSIFQTLPLQIMVQMLGMKFQIEYLAFRTEQEALDHHRKYTEIYKKMVLTFSEGYNAWEEYAKICQVISHRYFPYANSDGLTISVPVQEFTGFDFFEFRRNWDAKKFLKEIELTVDDIEKAWEGVAHHAEYISPISAWNELIDFIKKEKRERLKDKALLAETWKLMAKMLNLFYEDLTERKLHMHGDSPERIEVYRGKGITKDNLQYMEFVANDFGVNPRPKLILMVEGEGEFNEIPRITKWAFGKSLAAYRIQIINLKSIGEFNSRKIERFIDHYHDLQTIVYFVLDNENNSLRTRDTLVYKQSRYIENLTITKKDFFTIWDKNIEFDNFSDKEIAEAMTTLCENRYSFTASDVKKCRADHGKRRDPLSELYKTNLNYDLDKPKMLEILFDVVELNYKMTIGGEEKNRPIIDVIDEIRHLALRNYQPYSSDAWEENQHSGYLRDSKT
jgi:hypothetical protein